MGYFDSLIISGALASHPDLRRNLQTLVVRVLGYRPSSEYFLKVERNLVRSLRLPDAMRMPSSLPPEGHPLRLTFGQMSIVRQTIGRFGDGELRETLLGSLESAVANGSVVQVSDA